MSHKKLQEKYPLESPPETLKNKQGVPGVIIKFLKYQENIESASPHTLRAYAKDLVDALGHVDFACISSEQLIEACHKAQIRWGALSQASRNRKGACLKSFLKYLLSVDIIKSDLSYQVILPKVPRKIPHFISIDEAIGVLKSIKGPQERVLFLLLYGCGLRISEACSLAWSQIQFNQRTIRILGKGKKERFVVIPKSLEEELQKLSKTENYLWGSSELPIRKAFTMVRRMGVTAGLMKPLHPHALRHSFATHLLTSGANLRVLQELLGHESLQATEKYTHLSMDNLARTLASHHPLGDKK